MRGRTGSYTQYMPCSTGLSGRRVESPAQEMLSKSCFGQPLYEGVSRRCDLQTTGSDVASIALLRARNSFDLIGLGVPRRNISMDKFKNVGRGTICIALLVKSKDVMHGAEA